MVLISELYITLMSNIFIYSGPVRSGKTTRIGQWVKSNPHIDGILAPRIDGQRYVQRISSGVYRRIEISNPAANESIISIGHYRFSAAVFRWARKELLSCLQIPSLQWLVVDEIGPLELQGQGLEPAVSEILKCCREAPSFRLLLIIRQSLLAEAGAHYQWQAHEFLPETI